MMDMKCELKLTLKNGGVVLDTILVTTPTMKSLPYNLKWVGMSAERMMIDMGIDKEDLCSVACTIQYKDPEDNVSCKHKNTRGATAMHSRCTDCGALIED